MALVENEKVVVEADTMEATERQETKDAEERRQAPEKDDELPATLPGESDAEKHKRLCREIIRARNLKGRGALNEARKIVKEEGLMPVAPKVKTDKRAPILIWEKDEKKDKKKDDEEPEAKRRRPMDVNKTDLLQKILAGGAIVSMEEYDIGRKLLNSQNSMYCRAQKEGKPCDEYAKKVLVIQKAVDLVTSTFDVKYGARGVENTKTARTIINGVEKLNMAATLANDENREKDAEIVRLKAEIDALRNKQ